MAGASATLFHWKVGRVSLNKVQNLIVIFYNLACIVVIINYHICNSDELEVTFEVETNFAKICWTRNPLGYLNHEGEVCDSVNENRKIEYSFKDLCSDEARRKQSSGYILCAPIFFRIEGNLLDMKLRLMLIYKS